MRFFKNKSVLKIWCMAYAVMLLLVIFTNMFITYNTGKQFAEKQKEMNRYNLENTAVTLDNVFMEAEATRNDITKNKIISAYADNNVINERTRLKAVEVVNELNAILQQKNYIIDCFCYYPNSDLIITPTKFSESETYYNLSVSGKEDEYSEWKKSLMEDAQRYGRGAVKSYDSTVDVIELTYHVTDSDKIEYVIRLYVKSSDIFRNIEENEDILIVANSRGKSYFSSDGNEYNFTEFLFEDEYEIKTVTYNNKTMYLCYFNSPYYEYQYRYVLLSENNSLFDQSAKIIGIGVVLSVFCVAGMLVVMWIITKWNRKRINDILEGFDDSENITTDEYQYIKSKIDLSRRNNDLLTDKLAMQMAVIKKEFLADYINGYTNYKDIDERLASYNIYPEHKNYYVVSLFVKDYGILSYDTKKDTEFVINNILEDLLDMQNVLFTKIDEIMIYIVNCSSESREKQSETIQIFERANDLAQEMLGINFAIGVSEIKQGFENTPKLFGQAATALGYERFYDTGETAFYDEMDHSDGEFNRYGEVAQRGNELIMCVKSNNREHAAEIINDLFAVTDSSGRGRWYYEGLAYNIFSNVISFAEQASLECCEDIIEITDSIRKSHTLTDIKEFVNRAVDIIFDAVEEGADEVNNIHIKVQSYVNEHFAEHDLDVSKLGEVLGMTPFYVSRIFKQCSGVKLGTYINDLRIEKAKQLLVEDKNMKVNEVADRVGYDNARTFLKIFKEKEGITPTQYRKA